VLEVSYLSPGDAVTFEISEASAGEDVHVLVGTRGFGPCMGPICLDVASPTLLGTITAGVDGTGELSLVVPATVSVGSTVTFQAASASGASEATTREVGAPRPVADIDFFVLIHTGEGTEPDCDPGPVTDCYDLAPAGASDGFLAASCAIEEATLADCENSRVESGGSWIDDTTSNKSCKLENFDLTLDRTDDAYDPRLAIRYEMCRDGLIDVLDGLGTIGVPAVVQFHGGFLQNLAHEDAHGGPFDFASHLVGNGHQLGLHHHTECELSTSAHCSDEEGLGAARSSFGTGWGLSGDRPDDKTEPDEQGESDTRLDSLLLVLDEIETWGGYFSAAGATPGPLCGWGTSHRLKEDLRFVDGTPLPPEDQPQFSALATAEISILTTGNEFPTTIEHACFDGSSGGATDMYRAFVHPIQLSSELVFYNSPSPKFGQTGNEDPTAPGSQQRDRFEEVLDCMNARVAHADDPSTDIVRYTGQRFIWGGTAHLHNMIEADPAQLPDAELGDPEYPAGVVELAELQVMMNEMITTFDADPARHLDVGSVLYDTLQTIDARRGVESYDFEIDLD